MVYEEVLVSRHEFTHFQMGFQETQESETKETVIDIHQFFRGVSASSKLYQKR
jgi:hypothetical protein